MIKVDELHKASVDDSSVIVNCVVLDAQPLYYDVGLLAIAAKGYKQ